MVRVTFNSAEQYPGVNGTATYSEKLEVGYRWYDAQKVEPLFPFGFGLSYTKFDFANLSVSPAADKGVSTVSLNVTNSGSREGAEVVQVYVAAPKSAGEPPKQLKGFTKVMLKPGESRHVTISLDPRAFSIWSIGKHQWTPAPGQHQILVGDSSGNLPLLASVTIPGT